MADPKHDVVNPMQAFICEESDEEEIPEPVSDEPDNRPANLDKPFVMDGYGAVRGLTALEHVRWREGLPQWLSTR